MPGDPDCPFCHGLGYLRQDVPLEHPDFGKVQICSCRQEQVTRQVRQRLFELSNLDELSHLTFDNFEARGRVGLWPQQADSLEIAYNQSQHFANSLDGWLLLTGGFGCGKTHLAAAIANFAVSLGVPTLFITVPDLLDALRFAFQDPGTTFEKRFEEIRQAPLLVMDDFGTQNATPWAQEKLFQIVNYRYTNRLPLVLTTNMVLDEIEGRIRSRLEDPDLVSTVRILASDYRNPTGDMGHHQLSSLELLNRCKFSSFDSRTKEEIDENDLKSLEKAFNAAHSFAENPRGWLILMGGYGSGKTHLAASIANMRADAQTPPLFIVVPDLLDHLRATFNPTSTVSLDRRFEEVRTAPLLILDDLGAQSHTPWVKEKLYQLFNYRYNAELPTVITTSMSLEEMDPRLRSRMIDKRLCAIYAITVPPYSGVEWKKSTPKGRRAR
jgi:DNA replication protein DnaC